MEHIWFATNNALNGVYQSVPSPILWAGLGAAFATAIAPVIKRRLFEPLHHRFDELHDHVERATGVSKESAQ